MSGGVVQEPSLLDKSLIRGVGVIALFAAITGVARIAQDVAIASRFGTGPTVDAFYFLLSVANWPIAVALSLLTVLVVPTDALLASSGRTPVMRFRAELLALVTIIATVMLPLAWWALSAITTGGISGLSRSAIAAAGRGIPELIAIVPLGIVGALFSAWFVARSRHVLTLLEAVPPLVLTVVVLNLAGPVLFWGASAGIAAQVLLMVAILGGARELPVPRVGLSPQAWQGISSGATAMLVGQVLFALVPLMDSFFAARMGDGAVSALSYAGRLVLGLLGIAGLALQRGGLPLLSRLSAQSPAASVNVAMRWSVAAAGFGAIVALLVALLAEPIVAVLFERGGFTGSDREEVASLLRCGMLQVPPYVGGIVLVIALASMRAHRILAIAAAVGVAAKLLLNSILAPSLGLTGLPLATAGMYVTTTAIALFALRSGSLMQHRSR